ncbi:hypothetical protein BJ166DRAFT_574256 [Pestalotiopsis sp. NC0098]|nr:hypothetical protein BJ166DRAFT_574256 [Pestalotiopsis sp. NC0098]
MDNVYEIDGPIARQYSDLDDAVKREVREYYQTWAQHHLEDPAEFNEAELQELVDDQVFSGWNGDTKIMEPEMEWPRLKDIYVRVGIFSKDLPDPKRSRSLLETNFVYEILVFLGLKDSYVPSPARRARQAAFLRTRLDKSSDAIAYDWLDVDGKYVPYTYIDFQTADNKPQRETIVQAYQRADNAWVKACDRWNAKLCVYLCRRKIWDACHRLAWNPIREKQVAHRVNNFVQGPRTYKRIQPIISELQAHALLMSNREIRGMDGRGFRVRPADEGHLHLPD